MIEISVTYADILNGEPFSELSCPIALAIHRATGVEPEVNSRRIKVGGNAIPTPDIARDFIELYDEDDEDWTPDPIEFQIPDLNDTTAWRTQCEECGRLVALGHVDEDGYCEDCHEDGNPAAKGGA